MKNQSKTLSTIGKATFSDFEGYKGHFEEVYPCWSREIWTNHFYKKQSTIEGPYVCKAYRNTFPPNSFMTDWERQHSWEEFASVQCYLANNNLSWDVKYINEDPCYMVLAYGSNQDHCYVIPDWTDYVSFVPFTDYSEMPLSAIKRLGQDAVGSSELLHRDGLANTSVKDIHRDMDKKKEELSVLKARMQEVEEARTGELAELRQQMEALQKTLEEKKQLQMARLLEIQTQMKEQMEKLKRDLYMIETEIYSIRCLLGETVEFLRIRQGKNAPVDMPVVLYQKMRFLDEDMGKFNIMFSPNASLTESLETALATNDQMMDMFLPNEKCISILKDSRDGKIYASHENVRNMLDIYERLHGTQIAILVRNGENIYIGWTDEEKINVSGEDFFLTPKISSEPIDNKEDDYFTKAYREEEQKINLRSAVSRYFLFSILNGISIGDNPLLPMPVFNTPAEKKKHIILSMADNWLPDSRFGSFNDIIARCNDRMTVGDYLLTVMDLRPQGTTRDSCWINDRGRGDANRTHDVSANDCTIYRLNLIEEDPPVEMVCYTDSNGIDKGWVTPKKHIARLSEGCRILSEYTVREKHLFISLRKMWSDSDARANFEVFPDEVINLTYMNSVWLNYVLSSKNVMGWTVGGQRVNYNYALRYIATALKHIRGREEMEKARIDAVEGGMKVTANPNWPVWLSEWKLKYHVRQITDYQAKRFVKSLGEIPNSV